MHRLGTLEPSGEDASGVWSSLSPVTYEQYIDDVVKVVETVGTGIMVIGGLGAFLAFLRDRSRRLEKSRVVRTASPQPWPLHPARA